MIKFLGGFEPLRSKGGGGTLTLGVLPSAHLREDIHKKLVFLVIEPWFLVVEPHGRYIITLNV